LINVQTEDKLAPKNTAAIISKERPK
jgi:hypothetical protein